MIILKIGGSVITDKSKKETFKQKTMDEISEVLAKTKKEFIIVHGAGSFGHILAKRYDLNSGYKNYDQIKGFSLTHEKVQQLNSMVLKSLQKKSIPAVSISPHSILRLNNHELEKMNVEVFEEYIEKNFVPVTFGDVVLDKKLGFSICSGDLLIQILSKYFKPDKVVFAIDEDGLFTANPKIDKKAKLIQETNLEKLKNISTKKDLHADVTGGMQGKINTIKNISKLGINTILINGNKPDRLYKALSGKKTKCTIIYGEKNE